MSTRSIGLDESLHSYLLDVSLKEPDVMRRLREETAEMEQSNMQIAPEQGQFMTWLVGALGVERAIEVGTFTGYSAMAIARALPEEGRLICCDVSEEYTAVARRYWDEAGLAGRIDLRLGPAADTLASLVEEQLEDSFDFVFIDADKPGYPTYYEHALRLLRPGGVVAIDNTLWDGDVADPSVTDETTQLIRDFNAMLHDDDRVELSLLPIADGLTLARLVDDAVLHGPRM